MLWHPLGAKLDALPNNVRAALAEIINPAFEELVQAAPTALEKTTGLTYLNLLWVEVFEQFNMASLLWQMSTAEFYFQNLAGYLRVVGAKHQFAKFLLHAKKVRAKHGL